MLVPTFACDWFWWFNQLLGVVSHVSYYCYCNLKYDAKACFCKMDGSSVLDLRTMSQLL